MSYFQNPHTVEEAVKDLKQPYTTIKNRIYNHTSNPTSETSYIENITPQGRIATYRVRQGGTVGQITLVLPNGNTDILENFAKDQYSSSQFGLKLNLIHAIMYDVCFENIQSQDTEILSATTVRDYTLEFIQEIKAISTYLEQLLSCDISPGDGKG